MKSIPLSVRVSPEEAAFLASIDIPNAITPSEKLRAIIQDAKHQRQGPKTYVDANAIAQNWLAPTYEKIANAEAETESFSSLMMNTNDWLRELLAFISLSTSQLDKDENMTSNLQKLEAGIVDRQLRLFENLLLKALTDSSYCYQKNVISSRIEPISEVAQLLLDLKERDTK